MSGSGPNKSGSETLVSAVPKVLSRIDRRKCFPSPTGPLSLWGAGGDGGMPGPDGAGWGSGGQDSSAASSSWAAKGGWGGGNTGQQATERPTAAGQRSTDGAMLELIFGIWNDLFGSRIQVADPDSGAFSTRDPVWVKNPDPVLDPG